MFTGVHHDFMVRLVVVVYSCSEEYPSLLDYVSSAYFNVFMIFFKYPRYTPLSRT